MSLSLLAMVLNETSSARSVSTALYRVWDSYLSDTVVESGHFVHMSSRFCEQRASQACRAECKFA